MLTENTVYLQQTMQTGFVLCFKTNAIAIVIVITFNVIVIDISKNYDISKIEYLKNTLWFCLFVIVIEQMASNRNRLHL